MTAVQACIPPSHDPLDEVQVSLCRSRMVGGTYFCTVFKTGARTLFLYRRRAVTVMLFQLCVLYTFRNRVFCFVIYIMVRGFVFIVVTGLFFYGEELLAPRSTPRLDDRPLSAVRDYLFNIFAASLHTWRASSPSATGGRAIS
jgi:hypothetical protein